MRYTHIIEAVSRRPWMITPEAHHSICMLLEKKLKADFSNQKLEDREGFFGETLESMQIVDGIAYIPVKGILARGVSAIEKSCGVCDYGDIETDLLEASNDETVVGIVLDIDSPGGTVNGLYEVAQEIESVNAKKPVVAHTSGQMCSAAYYIAAACSAVTASPSSSVGSVGVIIQVLDETKALEMEGLKIETFRSDPMKAVGARGTSLTDDQRKYIQSIVDESAQGFKKHVMHNRRISDESALDGRVFSAETAKRLGFVDEVVKSARDASLLIK